MELSVETTGRLTKIVMLMDENPGRTRSDIAKLMSQTPNYIGDLANIGEAHGYFEPSPQGKDSGKTLHAPLRPTHWGRYMAGLPVCPIHTVSHSKP